MAFHTWLDDGIVRDFKGGDFLFWRHSCIPEHLHLLFSPLSATVMKNKDGWGGKKEVLKEVKAVSSSWTLAF